MNDALISIIMPMRDAERYVDEAIRSLLAQRDVSIEIVVIDDGSTDRSADIIRAIDDARIRLIPGPQRGIAAALNAGLAAARGEYFARCDADDVYAPDRLARQLAVLRTRPDFAAVCGKYVLMTASGREVLDPVHHDQPEDITSELRRGVGRTHLCTYLVRMNVVRSLEGFRDFFVGTEDSDFLLRLGDSARVWYEPSRDYFYRLHGESITHKQPSALRDWYERTMLEFQKQRQSRGQDDLQLGHPPTVPVFNAIAKSPARQMQEVLLGRAWKLHHAGQKRSAIAIGLRGCLARPITLRAWRSFVALVLKSPRSSSVRSV